MSYFIGNVLSPTATQPEADDPTFAFTRDETLALDMTNVPIRMEHHNDMEVGTIKRSWTDTDGRLWVLGKLNDDNFQSKFAKHAISEGEHGAYYTGLSLQHMHTQYASGKSKKTAIEVSLCVNPRRSDCRIAFVSNTLNQTQREKVTYKIKQYASKMSTEQIAPEAPQPTEEVKQVEPAAPTQAEAAPEQTEMSREEMMKVIIKQQEEFEAMKSTKTKEQEELEELRTMLQKQKDDEAAKTLAAAKALSEDLINQWAKNLDKSEMTEENRKSILQMAEQFPEQSMQLLRVAHCASRAHATQIKKFNEFKEISQKTELQEKFTAVMQKKRPAPVVHAASTKKQKHSTENMALSIVKQYRSSGSARDHMTALMDMQQPKKRGRRAPYY
jgi:hypothetical protein